MTKQQLKKSLELKQFPRSSNYDPEWMCQAEAHALPYAEEFFDAIMSVDAYHYFGTNELYLFDLIKLVKSGGQIGIVVPGLLKEFEDEL